MLKLRGRDLHKRTITIRKTNKHREQVVTERTYKQTNTTTMREGERDRDRQTGKQIDRKTRTQKMNNNEYKFWSMEELFKKTVQY